MEPKEGEGGTGPRTAFVLDLNPPSPAIRVVVPATLLFLAGAAVLERVALQFEGMMGTLPWLLVGLLVVVGSGAFAIRTLQTRKRRPALSVAELFVDHLRIGLVAGAQPLSIRYRDLDRVVLHRRARGGFLLLGTGPQDLVLPVSSFESPEKAESFRRELLARIEGVVPMGTERLLRMAKEESATNEILGRSPKATLGILGLLSICFLLQNLAGAQFDAMVFLRIGANVRALVAEGEVYRLVSANFLHMGLIHFLVNAVAIGSLGMALERMLGSTRMSLVYLFGALSGAIATAAADVTLGMGASTASMGLFGAFAWLSYKHGERMPAVYRQTRTWWWIIVILNLALPAFMPMIDQVAHVGGFLGGGLLAVLVIPDEDAPLGSWSVPPALRAFAGALVLIFGVGLTQAVLGYYRFDEARERDYLRIIADRYPDPTFLNFYAWSVAVDPEATKFRLETALDAAERAKEGAKKESEDVRSAVDDTLATVAFRLGDGPRAIALETQVLAARKDRFSSTQLSRFLEIRPDAPVPFLADGAVDIHPRVSTSTGAHGRERRLILNVTRESEADQNVFLIVRRGGQAHGLVRFFQGARSTGDVAAIALEWNGDEELELALVSPGAQSTQFWPTDPEAAKLPGPVVAERPSAHSSPAPVD